MRGTRSQRDDVMLLVLSKGLHATNACSAVFQISSISLLSAVVFYRRGSKSVAILEKNHADNV